MLKQCRLCFKQAQETISIYGISNGMLVANMIDSVIPELVIEDNEKLKFSSEICNCCLEIISSACELRKISIENDQKLKEAAIQPEIKTEIQTQFIKCEPDSDNDDDSFYQQDAVSCASTTNKQPSKVTKPKPPAVTVDRSNSLDRKRGRPRKLKEKSQVPGGRRFCTICKKKFKSIKLHKFIHVDYVEEYQEPGPTILTCPLCLYQTLNKEEIEIHLNTHENDFDSNKTLPCLKCTSAFTTFEAFIKHSKKHNAIFTHRCLKCLKRFEFGETLLRHLQHHSYYTCDYCGLSNKRKEKVQEHILGVHFSIKSHLCPTCGISFTTGGGLRLHLETCNQEVKKFKCKLCPKSFSQLGALNRHQSVHVTDAVSFEFRVHFCCFHSHYPFRPFNAINVPRSSKLTAI